ncbi:MAG: hypothetical protein C4B58_13955 [Deltaproteobacteria bacterium]|nr:MAG: hypothetical protein C4B58_13955 [Deltaproteobacteria bacterium]
MSFRLEEMTTEDKLKAMEILWDDICRNLPDFLLPAWHENILKEREQKLREGKDKFVDWDQAKKELIKLTRNGWMLR